MDRLLLFQRILSSRSINSFFITSDLVRASFFKRLTLLFLTFLPFLCIAQFPYNETFKHSQAPSVVFGGVPPAYLTATSIDTEGNGYLRLTNNSGNQKAFIYSNNVFLGTYGLDISFEYYTYGGNGADGICFFLFDAAITNATFNIGGFGGSLGYAQINGTPGVSKGYLGIGLDEFGNFSSSSEDRQGGIGQMANSVTLRGAGNGSAAVSTNYPYLTSKKTTSLSNSFSIAGGSRTDTIPSLPGYRKVFINLTPGTGGGLLINVNIEHGNVITPVITNYLYNQPIPAAGLKYGIASSTGGSNNYHEIRGLSIVVDPSALSTPQAVSDPSSGCQGQPQIIDILANDTRPNANGSPNPASVDLNPSTTTIEQSITITGEGKYEFNQSTQRLTFTPVAGFTGTSTINYNFKDVYGALSTTAAVTITTLFPKITAQPQSATVCEGSAFTTTVGVDSGTGSTSYQWQYLNMSSNTWINLTDGGNISGSSTNTLTVSNITKTINGRQYRVVLTSSGGCSVNSNPATVTVNPLSVASISGVTSVCQSANAVILTFTGSGGTAPYTFTYTVNDGTTTSEIRSVSSTGTSSSTTVTQPSNNPGTFLYTITSITDNSSTQCKNPQAVQSTVKVNPLPLAAISPDINVCQSAASPSLTFTGSNGTAPYTFTYTINGGAPQTTSSLAGSSVASVVVPTGTVGTFVYKIINISDNSSSQCNNPQMVQSTVTVNPLPSAAISPGISVCESAAASLTFTGSNGTAPYTFTYTVNDGTTTSEIRTVSSTGTSNSTTVTQPSDNPGTFLYTITGITDKSSTQCNNPQMVQSTVTVNPTPTVVNPGDQAYCNQGTTTPIHFTGTVNGTTYSWTNDNPNIGLATSGSGDIPSFTALNTTNAAILAHITVIPNTPAGCPGVSKAFTITVNPTATVTTPADQIKCNGTNTEAINFAGTVDGTTYSWSNDNPNIGLAATGSGNIPSFTAINTTHAAILAHITVIPNTPAGCPGVGRTFTITVNPTATVATPANQIKCNGTNTEAINFAGTVDGTTYSWTNDNTGIGLDATGSGNIPSFTAINTTNAAILAHITVIPNTPAGCPGVSKAFTITVNPTATVATPADQIKCNGTNTEAINFAGTVDGTTYSWANDNTSIGLAATGSGNIPSFTAINTTNIAILAHITVIPNTPAGCPGVGRTFTITVNPTATVATPADQIKCNGTNTEAINFAGTVDGTTYSWANDNPNIGLAATGSGNIPSFTAINTTNIAILAHITVTPITPAGCPGEPKTFTIKVNPIPTVLNPGDQAYCNQGTTTPIHFTGTVNGTTYSWTNDNPNIGLATSGSGDIPSFTALNTTHAAILAHITVIPNTPAGCPGVSKAFTITVNPTATVATPADQIKCNGTNTEAINFAGTVDGTTYSWTNDNTGIGLAATGSGNIPSFTAINTTHAAILAHITVIPNTPAGCPGVGRTFTITVNPTATVATPANQIKCNGANTEAINFAGTVNGTTYSWSNDNPNIGLAATGSGNIPSFTAINTTNIAILAHITVIPNTPAGCPGVARTFTIMVNPTATVATPANQIKCNGTNTEAINFAGTVDGTTYSWTNDSPDIGLAATGSGNIPSFTAINTTNAAILAHITVTPITPAGCPGEPKTFTIKVNPIPTVLNPGDQAYCNQGTTTPIHFTGTVNGTTYSWTNDNPNIGLATSGSGDIPSFTALNTTNAAILAHITVIPNTSAGCPGVSKAFTITVNPTATVATPADQIKCNGTNTEAINFAGTVDGTTYSWSNDNPNIGLAATGSGNIPSFTAINTTHAAILAHITVIPNTPAGCPGVGRTFTITVNPTATVATPANQIKCNGTNTEAINFAGTVDGTTYSWTNDNTGIGLDATGSGNIPSFTAINTTNAAILAHITVIPNTPAGCPGVSKAFTITVNPTATVATPADQIKCNGTNTEAINFAGTVDGTTYSWSNDNPNIGLAATGSGNIPSFTAINTTHAAILAHITVIPNTPAGCPGVGRTFTITVNPTATVATPANQIKCNGTNTEAINFAGTVDGTTYSWTNDNTGIGLDATGSGNIPSFTAINTTNAAILAHITVIPNTPAGCPGVGRTFTITVNPTATVATPANQIKCNGTNTEAINFAGTVDGTTYSWTNDNTGIGLAATGSGNIPSFTAINTSNAAISAHITVIPNTPAGCPGVSRTFTITVNPTATVATPANQIKCNGANTEAINFARIVDGTSYSWTNDNTGIGLAATGSGNIPSFTAINTTNVVTTATITVIPTTPAGCPGEPKTFTITVNPNTNLQLNSPAGTANQTLCVNNDLTAITYQTTNATAASVSGLPQGVTGQLVDGIFTINGTPTTLGTFTYTVTATGICTTVQLTGTITVNPHPIGFNDVVNSLTCGSTSFNYNLQDNINNTGNGGNSVPATFSWTITPNANVKGMEDGSGNTISATLMNTSETVQQAVYTITPTSILGGCPGQPFTLTVNVPVCSSISITKTADVNVVSKAGNQIKYTITVKNTGSANHTNVRVTDPFLGGVLTGPVSGDDNGNNILEAGESWIYTGTYTVTQADLDNNGKPTAGTGSIINIATVNTAEQPTPETASSKVNIVATGSIALVKVGVITRDFSSITYLFTIINTGSVRLHNLDLEDLKTGGKVTLSADVIDVGSSILATVTYTVSDQEKRDGLVTNTATIGGVTPAGDVVTDISGTQQDNNTPTVVNIDDKPVAVNDHAETKIDQPVTFTITGNDLPSFNGLDAGSVVITRYPLRGQVQVFPDGTVTYTPDKGFAGPDDFTYTVTDLKGKVSNKAVVSINVSLIDLFIPNTFTPNGDGKNDTFQIIGIEDFDNVNMVIVNRWGNEVYVNKNYLNQWDGSGLSEGTYYYIIVFKKGAAQTVKKGWILLKR